MIFIVLINVLLAAAIVATIVTLHMWAIRNPLHTAERRPARARRRTTRPVSRLRQAPGAPQGRPAAS